MGSKRMGAVSLSIVVLAAVGVVSAGISGVLLEDPVSDFVGQGDSSANSSQCQIWKNRTQTAGIDDTDEYERKYNNRCDGDPLDEQVEEGNFYSEEYNESDHTGSFEEATSECRIGECRSQSVCLANGAQVGESCGIGGTCCTLQENKDIEYEESEGNAGEGSGSDDGFINDPSEPGGGDDSDSEDPVDIEDPVTVSGSGQGIYPISYDADSGNQYFVSPDGRSSGSGSRNDPWNIEKANEEASAGDIINFLAGTYDENLRPDNSGDEDNPIVFRSEERYQAVISRDSGWDVHLRGGQDNVVIEGFKLEISGGARWLRAENNQNLVIRDNIFKGGSSQAPLEFYDVDGVRFSNNIVDNLPAETGESFAPEGDNIVMEGNYMERGWHGSMAMFDEDNDNIVARGNVFAGITGRTAEFNRPSTVLFENNVVTQGAGGPGSGGSSGKFNVENSIFRNNRLYKNWGTATTLTTRNDQMSVENTKLYNNIWDDNGGGLFSPAAVRVNNYGDASRFDNMEMKNNLFSRNGYQDVVGNNIDGQQLHIDRDENSGVSARNNLFYMDRGMEPHIRQRYSGDSLFSDGNLIDISEADNWPGWRDNQIIDETGIPNLDIYDYVKSSGSPLDNGGEALTETTSSGSGTEVPVEDGYYFYDGWADPMRQGDLVQIGDEEARVVERSGNSIELDRSITWNDGDPVSLPWSGSSPDIGPFERGEGGRPHVILRSEKQMVEKGNQIAFEAIARNIDVKEICWQMGDGVGQCGTETSINHVYDGHGGKGVRVRVRSTDDKFYWGTRFIMVKESGREDLYGDGNAYNQPTYDSDPNFDTVNMPGYSAKMMNQICDARGNPGIELNYEQEIDKDTSGWDCGGTSIYN